MSNLGEQFLTSILGPEGFKALKKAIEREPALADILTPRAILGWLNAASDLSFEGGLPGLENSYIQFQKNEDGFSGNISFEEGTYSFEKSNIYHLASAVAMALNVPPGNLDADVRDAVLVKLGKSIDTLISAQMLTQELQLRKSLKPTRMTTMGSYHIEHAGQGPNPYSVVHTRTSSPVQSNITTLKDAQGIAQWHQNKYKGFFTPKLDKAVLPESSPYKISHEHHDLGDGDFLTKLSVHGPDNKYVGGSLFTHKNNNLVPEGVQVDPAHRRKGIASAMYAHAEKLTGKKIIPSHDQTALGQKLWEGNKKLPQFGKTDLPGTTAKPQKQVEPLAPQVPKKQPKMQTPKMPSLSVGKSEAMNPCEMCSGYQFKDNKFVGCICYSSLSKNIVTTSYQDGIVLDFKPGIDIEAVRSLMRTLKGRG